MNIDFIILAITIFGVLSVLITAGFIAIRSYMKHKAKEQRFVTRREVYDMGYDNGFLNKGYDATQFNFINDDEIRSDMLLIYRGGFVEGLNDYHYLLKNQANLN